MAKFRKKPVVIEAVQWTGDNFADVAKLGDNIMGPYGRELAHLEIPTLEGRMVANLGDWVIRGVNGEVYPCKPDIFEKTYEPAQENFQDAVRADPDMTPEQKAKWLDSPPPSAVA